MSTVFEILYFKTFLKVFKVCTVTFYTTFVVFLFFVIEYSPIFNSVSLLL